MALLGLRYAARFGVPVILFFIAVGMLAGSEGLGGIEFENYHLSRLVSSLALVVILFDGGFHTETRLFRLGLWPALSLAVFGTIATAALVGVFAVFVLDFNWLEGLLLGSVVCPTDAAAVFTGLRRQNLTLKKRVQAVLEIESGSNDPPAVYLTVAMTALLLRGQSPGLSLLTGFVLQMGLGLVLGWAGGRGIGWLLHRVRFGWPSLYPLLVLIAALFLFACTNLMGGSGYLAVYVAGVTLGAQRLPFQPLLSRFQDGLSWLMQIVMFVMLGLLVFPSRLLAVTLPAIGLALFLILFARPLTTLIFLTGSGLNLKERFLVAWGGLRGAVPIILAIHPLTEGVERSHTIFNIVFFVVLLSVALQGGTMARVARWLHLHLPSHEPPPLHVELASWNILDGEVLLFRVTEGSEAAGKYLRDLPLPSDALAMLIVRRDDLITPRGSTQLLSGDTVYFFAKRRAIPFVERLFAAG